MEKSEIIVYGTSWCGDCRRTLNFLDRNGIAHTWIDIDSDPAASNRVIEINAGKRIVPTILFPDGDIFVEPSDQDLAEKLGGS